VSHGRRGVFQILYFELVEEVAALVLEVAALVLDVQWMAQSDSCNIFRHVVRLFGDSFCHVGRRGGRRL
jgi:hypothetical protein